MSNQRQLTNWISQKQLRLPNVIFQLLKPPSHYPPTKHIFYVPLNYNKIQISNYLQQLYNITPVSVHTEITYGGKRQNPYNPRWKLNVSDKKKAYITLSEQDAFKYPTLDEQRILGSAPDSKT
jgi:ribosomal protein L23